MVVQTHTLPNVRDLRLRFATNFVQLFQQKVVCDCNFWESLSTMSGIACDWNMY